MTYIVIRRCIGCSVRNFVYIHTLSLVFENTHRTDNDIIYDNFVIFFISFKKNIP